MTSKELVIKNYNFQPVERFTIDFCACSEIYAALRQHYGVETDLELMETLHVDFRYPKPNWIGFPLKDDQGNDTDYFGIPRNKVGEFGYSMSHPLAGVSSIEEADAYPLWPTAEMWDYDQYALDCQKFEEYAVLGGAWGWFFDAACDLIGMEEWFMLLYDNPKLAHHILDKITVFFEDTSKYMFEKAGKYIDICFTGDDYGFQRGPMMSEKMFDEFVRPYAQRLYDQGRKNNKIVMQHSCGSVSSWIPRFLDMGLNVLEPVQVGAANMNPKDLAAKWGGKLCFHGSIDTQGTLPFGTPEAVRKEVKERVETFKPYGGFTIAPSQHLLTDIPIENIVAMYDAAWEYCWLN